MSSPLFYGQMVVFDVETSGLEPGNHEVIQIAAIAIDGSWTELDSIEMKLRFDLKRASKEALEINHYDPAVWASEAIDRGDGLNRLTAFFKRHATLRKVSARTNRPYSVAQLCGHNARFDGDHLAAWYKAHDAFCPAACYEPLCTLNLARWVTQSMPNPPANHKLGPLCSFFGLPEFEAHDALADVRATARLAQYLSGRLLPWPLAGAVE